MEETTFTGMVVPIVLQKLPEAFRLTITRGADFLNWSMEELLSTFLKELELREDHYYAMFAVGNTQNRKDINTLYMKQEVENCAFCRGRHAPANCMKVNDVNAPKNILIKYSRCFKVHLTPKIVFRLIESTRYSKHFGAKIFEFA